ncbi:MAG TPA: hypothetical protein VM620_10320 [Hyphomicrobium sp.]|nr:hypothetical protein [Hyphomicrobium sp.]
MSVLNFRASKVSRLSGLRALLNEKQRLAQTYQKGRAIQTTLTPLVADIMPTFAPPLTSPSRGGEIPLVRGEHGDWIDEKAKSGAIGTPRGNR